MTGLAAAAAGAAGAARAAALGVDLHARVVAALGRFVVGGVPPVLHDLAVLDLGGGRDRGPCEEGPENAAFALAHAERGGGDALLVVG